MGKIKYLISKYRSSRFILLVLFSFLFFVLGTQKVWAVEEPSNPEPGSGDGVVINEVMANAPTPESDFEWVELYNAGSVSVDLKNWTFDGKVISSTTLILEADNFLILVRNREAFINHWPDVTAQIIQLSMTLTNGGDTVILESANGLYSEEFSWTSDSGDNISWEKIDPSVSGNTNWQESYVLGGTPGAPNSEFIPPNCPDEVRGLVNCKDALIYTVQASSITDGDTIKVSGLPTNFSSTIRFLAVDSAESGQPLFEPARDFTSQLAGKSVDLLISKIPEEQTDSFGRTLAVIIFDNQVFNTQLLERGLASFYDTDNAVLNNTAWQAIEAQAQQELIGLWASTSSSVILSEFLPNPVGLDNEDEWIELYNPLGLKVNLSYFLLGDYLIPYRTIISPQNFMVFPRPQTRIALNNSGGNVKLFFPDGLLADEVSFGKAKEGLSWAFANGTWQWTLTPTPEEANVITSPDSEEVGDDEENLDIPLNSEPIEIKTGEIKNYENYLVKITGTVVQTSGNTFYLDDGSGKVKVYIQAATGINKPEMRKGDIFEIIGIVNFYRGVWRILPQKQEDIKLVQAKKEEEVDSESKVKTASVKSATASKSKSSTTAKARAPTTKKVASEITTNNLGNQSTQVEGYQAPFWIEVIKAFTGLALIFLIILIVKLWKLKKDNPSAGGPLGGSFGDDYT